jgi:hypothetical protein
MVGEDRHARPPGPGLVEIEGMRVAPPVTEHQGRLLAAAGLLADDVAGLQRAWLRLRQTWDGTVDRATRLGSRALHDGVNGEWSFLETLRHLVFVTDAWVGAGLLGTAYHPLGVPPHFVTNGVELGLRPGAAPPVDDVLIARRGRQDTVGSALGSIADTDLTRPCLGSLSAFTALGALQVVVAEELFHHGFATRDLAVVEERERRRSASAGGGGTPGTPGR